MNEDKPVAKGEARDKVDKITENVGMHPIGATVGAVGGAVAGAIGGLAAGPVGSLAGAVGGAVLGGAMGSSSGNIDPDVDLAAHKAYWSENYTRRPYVPAGASFDDYEPAYRYGSDAYLRGDRQRGWDDVEPELSSGWEAARGSSKLSWDDAKHAVRDAWERSSNAAEQALPGDADQDGR
ncbi:MAG TPA: hypothetical protein VKI18_04550 [Albitalea sp.]|nr:hypothetical protein [Albitalea sp.]